MPRPPRLDRPGALHHVLNRGCAQRPVFLDLSDVCKFESLLADEATAGRLRVHAYALLTNHFHLLVESPVGELAAAMRRVEHIYVIWFNQRRERDGSLFRGRFRSRPIVDENDFIRVVRYIDLNAVKAQLVVRPQDYPYSSAWHYSRRSGPHWLDRRRIEETVQHVRGRAGRDYEPADYARAFHPRLSASEWYQIERAVEHMQVPANGWASLLQAGPQHVVEWLLARTRLADGRLDRVGVLAPEAILEGLQREAARDPDWRVTPRTKAMPGWSLVRSGLLADLARSTVDEISRLVGVHPATARTRVADHAGMMERGSEYAARVGEVVQRLLHQELGNLSP